jgi:hypothetical protein
MERKTIVEPSKYKLIRRVVFLILFHVSMGQRYIQHTGHFNLKYMTHDLCLHLAFYILAQGLPSDIKTQIVSPHCEEDTDISRRPGEQGQA